MAPTNVPRASRSLDDGRPTVEDLRGDNEYTRFARKTWLGTKAPPKVNPDSLKREIWDVLETEGFPFRSLLILENLQILENYLWPGYTEDSSNYHVLLVILMVNAKQRENLPIWDTFSSKPSEFSTLFRRILSLNLDNSLSPVLRNQLLSFVTFSFQSLDNAVVRKECVPLVSISIWHSVANEASRESYLEEDKQAKKAWRLATKRYEAADETAQARMRFDRSWLYSMMLGFLTRLYRSSNADDDLYYCERFVEFLTDLESQIPTRRYVNTILHDLNILPAMKLSPMFNDDDNGLLRDLYQLLRHFVYFPVGGSVQKAEAGSYESHCRALAKLQRTALKYFKEKLTVLALSNYASIDQRVELEGILDTLTEKELISLCNSLGFRTTYPKTTEVVLDRAFFTEVLLSTYERKTTFQEAARELNILPTEMSLFEPTLLRNEIYNGARPLAIPKLNLQYLTTGDFLWRCFILHRCEAFYEIRRDIEDTIKRIQPRIAGPKAETIFEGFSRMALPIPKATILEVTPPKVGTETPAAVRAELELDIGRLGENVRREWESLRPGDVVFLLAVEAIDESEIRMIGGPKLSEHKTSGLKCLRAAEIVQLLDENGRQLRDRQSGYTNGYGPSGLPRLRRLHVNLDADMFKIDKERSANGKPDLYESMNLIIRRKGRENNFKPVLESIKSLTLSDVPIPRWLEDVFLGFGDPTAAHYTRLSTRIRSVDFRDTFLDWQHLIHSLPGKTVEPRDASTSSSGPPFILETASDSHEAAATKLSKKRRRDQIDPEQVQGDVVKASTYKPFNTGPYATDAPRLNQVRFTPAQVEAIVSGTQPGLSIIVGPPGTGKTDVATQIINNLYHNFPEQRTLLIAHSNQALNQLFQKIIALDIDERHLLRLGHGEEDLDTDVNYSKHGRVESFLENRTRLLSEVDRLAANFAAPGAHGNSCETAVYFNSVYVKPAWTRFHDLLQDLNIEIEEIVHAFPFHSYFSNAPQPLFPSNVSRNDISEIAVGCYRHVKKIFSELEDIRPFEILRSSRDKANYLLVKEARIIAMTTTHAAMRRQEIASLGFHYDNIIMEEAAQVTEIETFIPLALQKPKDDELPLQRVVLCGDHLQNSPIVQNLAFRQYAKLEQSLFLRLIRLGVPTINLDMQGRARPSLADLYRWRYQELGDLPSVKQDVEYQQANAGFRHDYQFIQVQDYKGVGESEPTPHFFQNLGEAEYAVAMYQYMRLLGYPASKISILTTYAGQRALLKDVLGHRCGRNRLFGLPKIVTTVDKYQGEQNDYVIVSLTRTSRVGYLRDIRRLTVALSRARLGLYILGRREVYESCFELKDAFERLLVRSDKLQLVTGEMYPSSRPLDAQADATEMDGVEHLGKYVYEMTQAKLASMNAMAGKNGDLLAQGAGNEEEGLVDCENGVAVDAEMDEEVDT
ncbi:MAG: hypothetical protein M1837_003639 [Sclerophora amabilis]|nr:MAG: hypothetical protein M1837_003639 [Sclerophora amabilis]